MGKFFDLKDSIPTMSVINVTNIQKYIDFHQRHVCECCWQCVEY